MTGISPKIAKITATLFALAMFYGSICSASCVAGVCPNVEYHSKSHDCDQPSHHSHGQDDPNCTQHAHPPDSALKVSGITLLQNQSPTLLHATTEIALWNPLSTPQDIRQETHRRPQGVTTNTLPEQVSVLRI
jgi:hypothetical protein